MGTDRGPAPATALGTPAGWPLILTRDGLFAIPTDTIAGAHETVARALQRDTPLVAVHLDTLPLESGHSDTGTGEADPSGSRVRARTPVLFEPDGDGWWACGEAGDAIRLDTATVRLIVHSRVARSVASLDHALGRALGNAFDRAASPVTVQSLCAAGILCEAATPLNSYRRSLIANARTRSRLAAKFEKFELPPVAPASDAPHVYAVWPAGPWREWTPLALAYLIAVARSQGVTADWVVPRSEEQLRRFAESSPPAVWLFSDYVWSTAANLSASAEVKAANPSHLVIHGGPSVPGYAAERAEFFDRHRDVDLVVHGEGEATFDAILSTLRTAAWYGADRALADLAGTPGTTVRQPTGLVTGPGRDRIADLDSIPSPYLTGIVDEFLDCGVSHMVMETYRGCPFGCTFCDWGSSTATRIRKFSLERVLAELDWAVERRLSQIVLADSNFGMLPRDVEVADRVAAAHETTGFPTQFHASWAKNPSARFERIVRRMVDSGVLAGGGLAIQTYDQATLANVDRSNIPPERFDRIWRLFRDLDLPMGGEFMIGLPGADRQTFQCDLQFCVTHEIYCLVHRTMLLPNNPMNDPAYKRRFAISADEGGFLEQTSSYDREQLLTMLADYQAVLGADFLGAARVAVRFLAQRLDTDEVHVIVELAHRARTERERFPALWWVLTMMGRFGAPPVGWDRYIAQLDEAVGELWPAVRGLEWSTVLIAQRGALPHLTVEYPTQVELPFDVAAWFAATREARLGGLGLADAPGLAEFGPGTFSVDDPWGVAEALDDLAQPHGTLGWELRSPFMRPGTRRSALIT